MDYDFSGLKALFVNCTLKRSPEKSNADGFIGISRDIMVKHGAEVSVLPIMTSRPASGPT